MSYDRAIYWLSVNVLIACAVIAGQVAAIPVAAMSSATLAYLQAQGHESDTA